MKLNDLQKSLHVGLATISGKEHWAHYWVGKEMGVNFMQAEIF